MFAKACLVVLFLVALRPVAAGQVIKFEMVKIREGVYAAIREGVPNLPADGNTTIIINQEDVLVVDTNITPSSARAVLAEIRKLTDRPVRYVVNTHHHSDHIYGNGVYREAFPQVEFVGHAAMREVFLKLNPAGQKQFVDQSRKTLAEAPERFRTGRKENGEAMTETERADLAAEVELLRKYLQGLRLLHCFWDAEAYRAFREAVRADPGCAMAHWGIFNALAQNGQEMAEERAAALKQAVALSGKATEHEQHYIRAAALLAEPGKGRPAWVAEMETLIDRFPADVEAKLLLANALSSPPSSYAPDGRPREGKLYGQAILRHLLVTHPNHAAVHHYWIHAVENGPRPQDALESALRLPRLAPGSGHTLHMPGHIYYRLGRYAEARTAFLASMRHDLAYMKRQQVNPINNWNYVHNLDYLVGNCAEDGRYREGARWAAMLQSLAVDQGRLKASGAGYILYGGHTALARLQMRYGKWEAAAASLAQAARRAGATGALSNEYLEGVLRYLRGMAAVEAGREEEAAAHARSLEELSKNLTGRRAQLGGDWYFAHAVRVLAVQAAELRGSLYSLQGYHEPAVELLREAAREERELGYWEPPHYARPVLESLGRAYLRAGQYSLAKEAFRQELKLRPESGHALWGLAEAADRAGTRPRPAATSGVCSAHGATPTPTCRNSSRRKPGRGRTWRAPAEHHCRPPHAPPAVAPPSHAQSPRRV